jgi:hypothetical protein
MSEINDALEAWRQAARDLEATMPWTAEWLRARMIEAELRSAYQALAGDPRSQERPARGVDVDEPTRTSADATTSVGPSDRLGQDRHPRITGGSRPRWRGWDR